MLVLMIPGALCLLLFFYVPILGNVIAFQEYYPFITIPEAEWVGLWNFIDLFGDEQFLIALRNTLVLAAVQLALFFPVPIVLALIVDSMMTLEIPQGLPVDRVPAPLPVLGARDRALPADAGRRRLHQPVPRLPRYGHDPLHDQPEHLPAAGDAAGDLEGRRLGHDHLPRRPRLDPGLASESAASDGAGRLQRIWHITLPGMRPVIVLLLILQLGSILTVGFEQFILQRDAVGPDAAEVLDTYSYYAGVIDGSWSMGAAAGLAKGVVGTILILASNKIAHLLGEDGIYRGSSR